MSTESSSSQSPSPPPRRPLTMASPPPPLQPQPAPPPPPPPSSAVGRRIPPPCWSNDETAALIDSYREKWHSLRRANLRAAHWQEVADGVAVRCPPRSLPAKTSVQCRHKMEKLRKRYRSELRRSLSIPHRRFTSSWVLFNKMHDMEKTEDDADVDNGGGIDSSRSELGFRSKKVGKFNPNFNEFDGSSSGVGFGSKKFGGFNPKSNHEASRVGMGTELGKRVKEGDELMGMVDAMKMLGEGFVKAERMKMDMVREMEQMRMEMERKRAQMIMESQRQLVEVFIKGIPEMMGKKAKRVSSSKLFLDTKEPDS